MRKPTLAIILASALVVLGYPNVGSAKRLPSGTIQQGSLANHQLTQDALSAVFGKVLSLGCQQFNSYTPYLVAMPKGPQGSRVWRERWIVSCKGADYPVDLRFREVGPNAEYEIL
jgi:hypothetical protein